MLPMDSADPGWLVRLFGNLDLEKIR
jgi:hypothetical protein